MAHLRDYLWRLCYRQLLRLLLYLSWQWYLRLRKCLTSKIVNFFCYNFGISFFIESRGARHVFWVGNAQSTVGFKICSGFLDLISGRIYFSLFLFLLVVLQCWEQSKSWRHQFLEVFAGLHISRITICCIWLGACGEIPLWSHVRLTDLVLCVYATGWLLMTVQRGRIKLRMLIL